MIYKITDNASLIPKAKSYSPLTNTFDLDSESIGLVSSTRNRLLDSFSPTISMFHDTSSGLDEIKAHLGCLSPCHANPSTPNESFRSDMEGRPPFSLNPCAKPFIPEFNSNSNIDELTSSPRLLSTDKESPQSVLQNLRLKNVDKVIIGHININSVRNKIHLLADIINGRVDILLISETKLDCTFPKPQFLTWIF